MHSDITLIKFEIIAWVGLTQPLNNSFTSSNNLNQII